MIMTWPNRVQLLFMSSNFFVHIVFPFIVELVMRERQASTALCGSTFERTFKRTARRPATASPHAAVTCPLGHAETVEVPCFPEPSQRLHIHSGQLFMHRTTLENCHDADEPAPHEATLLCTSEQTNSGM